MRIIKILNNKRELKMFKNTCFFKLQNDFNVDNLESQLSEFQFSPCGKHQPSSMGWVSALGHGSKALTHESQGRILIRLRHEGKILPVKVIKELVDDKVNEIKRIEDRPVKKKEKDQIKEDIIYSMLPQAFVQSSYIMAYIDTVSNLLVVDAPSRIKSNDFTAMLRKSIGSLPIDPVKETLDISDILTKWLTSCDLPDNGLTLDDNVILQSTEQGGSKATLKNEYLTGEEVKKHLDLGKVSTRARAVFY